MGHVGRRDGVGDEDLAHARGELAFFAAGLALHALFPSLLTPELWLGVLFVCTLSSTVQSSIAFTSIARGNVPAAICGATASNLLGIVFTPILVTLLLHRHQDGGYLLRVGIQYSWRVPLAGAVETQERSAPGTGKILCHTGS